MEPIPKPIRVDDEGQPLVRDGGSIHGADGKSIGVVDPDPLPTAGSTGTMIIPSGILYQD